MMPKTKCAMCYGEYDLMCSHIIPNSMHKDTKINGKNIKTLTGSDEFNEKNQTDLKEYLLCFECEQILSKVEKNALSALAKVSLDETYYIESTHSEVVQRFVRSVFWRASVSSICKKYKLDTNSENTLRNYLHTSSTLSKDSFAIHISLIPAISLMGPSKRSVMIEPWVWETDCGKVGYFTSGGILYQMTESIKNTNIKIESTLRKDNRYHIQYCDNQINNIFLNLLNEIKSKAILAK